MLITPTLRKCWWSWKQEHSKERGRSTDISTLAKHHKKYFKKELKILMNKHKQEINKDISITSSQNKIIIYEYAKLSISVAAAQ